MKAKKWTLFLVIAAVLGVLGYSYWQQQNTAALPDAIPSGNGRIEATQVNIATKIGGRIATINVREGDMVKAGDAVAEMEIVELTAQVKRAKADVAQQKSNVVAAKAAIKQREAELNLAIHTLERTTKLTKRDVRTRADLDRAVAETDTRRAVLEAAKASLVRAERAVEAAEAEKTRIQSYIDDSTLETPVTGRVLYRLAEPGEVLGNGGRVLTVLDLSEIYMEVFLPSSEAHRLALGTQARIKLDVLDVAIPAKVSFVSPTSQFTPKQVETLAEREKLMFRVKLSVPEELVQRYIYRVKTGVRGVAYIPYDTDDDFEWPKFLQRLPEGASSALSSNDALTGVQRETQ